MSSKKPLHVASAIWLFALASAPAAAQETIGRSAAALVYGEDGRVEAYAHPDPRLREIARTASAALVPKSALRASGDRFEFVAPSLAEENDFCEAEPFEEQPVLAACSGVLVAPDLLLTAAHCVDGPEECSELYVVFDYALSAEGRIELASDAIYECREIVTRELSHFSAPVLYDSALLRLDAPARPPRAPARVRREAVRADEALALIGNGLGLPTKIDSGGRAVVPRATTLDYFGAQFDLFHRGSGSGVFDAEGALVVIAVRGGSDFDGSETCQVLRSVPEETSEVEEASYAATALERAGFAGLIGAADEPPGASFGGGCAVQRSSERSRAGVSFVAALAALALFVERRRRSAKAGCRSFSERKGIAS